MLFLGPADLRGVTSRALEDLLERRDLVVASGEGDTWLEEWTRDRSVMALDSAAALIRGRGGDSLERAEFARLFAAGVPEGPGRIPRESKTDV